MIGHTIRYNLIKPSVFSVNSVKALRGAFVAIEEGKISEYSRGCFSAYWTNDKDISQEDVLQPIAESAGMDGEAFMAKITEDQSNGNSSGQRMKSSPAKASALRPSLSMKTICISATIALS